MATPTIEERLSELEKKMARLLGEEKQAENAVPWWERRFGAFRDDPMYDEAARLGAEYRQSQPTPADDDVSA